MNIRIGILTVSDRSSRDERPDLSGPVLVEMVKTQKWDVVETLILPDDLDILRDTLMLWSDSGDMDVILTTGGTGFAPIKGMIEHAFHAGIRRPMHLYWGVRSGRDLYLPDLPAQWEQTHPDFRFVPVLSEPDPDWAGHTGFVHQAVAADHPDMSGFDVYMAGPPIMVQAGRRAFEDAGLTLEHMFSDAFEYAADSKSNE